MHLHSNAPQSSALSTITRVSIAGFGVLALVVVLACGGVCGDTEEPAQNSGLTDEEQLEKEMMEGTGDTLLPTADSDIIKETLPSAMQTMLTCLNAKTPNELSRVTPSQAKSCLKTHFGKSKGPGRQCGGQPEEVYSSDVLNSCTFTPSTAKRGPLSKPKPGLGRIHAVFVGDKFQGLTMQSTRPAVGSSAPCGTAPLFAAQQKAIANEGEPRYSGYTIGGLEYKIERSEEDHFYHVVRDTYVLKIEGANASPALDLNWTRNKASDLPHAGNIPRDMRNEMQEIGDALGCSRYRGSLLGLLGQSLNKISRDCDAIKGGNRWAQWPVSEMRLTEGKSRFQLTAVGPEGTITEVFLRVEVPGATVLKNMKKEIGRSTPYQCTAHAWYAGKYIIRARPAGNFVNVAFSLADDHDNLSKVLPGATLGRSWR